MEGELQSFQKNFTKKSGEHLLLTNRLRPAIPASKAPRQQVFNSQTSGRSSSLCVCVMHEAILEGPSPTGILPQTAGGFGSGHVGSRRLNLMSSMGKPLFSKRI